MSKIRLTREQKRLRRERIKKYGDKSKSNCKTGIGTLLLTLLIWGCKDDN